MNSQDFIEQNVRMVIGDLTLQNVMLKARIAELEAAAAEAPESPPSVKGKKEEVHVNGQRQ